MKQNKAREEIVKLFMDCLHKEDIPWHQGFIPSRTSFNPITQTTYKNSNRFILYINEYIHHYNDPRWMTFKQATKAGYHIRRGEKGVPIEYWSIYDIKEKKSLTFLEASQLLREHPERKDDIRYISKVYTVFNAKQMDGIQPYIDEHTNKKDEIDDHFSLPYYLLYEFGFNTNLVIKEDSKANIPYYSLDNDKVVIPNHHRYNLSDAFFSDAFHEISHSTAHLSRLNRSISSFADNPEKYAIEELRAEIGSSFICNELGIVPHENQDYLENSQAYIQNWLKVIEEKPNTLFAAIKDAEAICDYVLENGHYHRLFSIQECVHNAVEEQKYDDCNFTKDDLRMLLRKDNIEVTSQEMRDMVEKWSENKESIDSTTYFAFEDDKVICADNTSNDMFMEEFEKEDYLLAFLWLAQGMAIDELMELKYQESVAMKVMG